MGGPTLNRVTPQGPAEAYKTYQVLAPAATHWRRASCEEVSCQHYMHGWATTVPTGGELEHTIRESGRHWSSATPMPDGTTVYVFPAGTPCFRAAQHRVRVRDDDLYIVRDGDWRGNPRGTAPYRHTRSVDFVDDWATHQQNIADAIQRG
jgi:hypothetical protein